MKIIIAYVPVLHSGYLEFFERHKDAGALYLFSSDLIGMFEFLKKDLRALPPILMKKIIDAIELPFMAHLADLKLIQMVVKESNALLIVMPDEDICRELAEKHLNGVEVIFDKVFLRYDKSRSLANTPINYDRKVKWRGLVGELMNLAVKESERSPDWWRQVGGVLSRGNQVLIYGCNTHMPSPYNAYVFGDPRSNFKKGIQIELSTANHVESRLIGEAARRGIPTHDANLFLTTFPCPPCSRLVAAAGIANLYYAEGYSMIEGEEVLRRAGVKIIFVENKNPNS